MFSFPLKFNPFICLHMHIHKLIFLFAEFDFLQGFYLGFVNDDQHKYAPKNLWAVLDDLFLEFICLLLTMENLI